MRTKRLVTIGRQVYLENLVKRQIMWELPNKTLPLALSSVTLNGCISECLFKERRERGPARHDGKQRPALFLRNVLYSIRWFRK